MVTGLAWGTFWGLWDNLPCTSMLYAMAVYQLLSALVLGLCGVLLWGILRLWRRTLGRAGLFSIYLGLAVGLCSVVLWLTGFDFLGINWGTVHPFLRQILTVTAGLGGALLGLLVGGAAYAALRWAQQYRRGQKWLRWALLRYVVLSIFVMSTVYLLGRGLYRAYMQDWPIFYPKPVGEAATPTRPNIILITVDSLRADHLGIYGYDPTISPNIDALARQGLLFGQALAQSSWTMPSVASFSTSLYPSELQVYCLQDQPACSSVLDPQRTTIAEMMQQAGYRTQAYLTNVWLQPHSGFQQGLDGVTYFRIAGPCDLEYLRQHAPIRFLYRYSRPFQQLFEKGYDLLFDPRLVGDNRGEQVSTYARRFLRQHQEERFFLWLYYMEPHTTYDPEVPFHPLPEDMPQWRENYLRSRDYATLLHTGPNLVKADELPALVSLYDGEIAATDRWVGQVLQELETLDLSESTLVVLMADHGEEFMDHGGYTHGRTFYQETIHVPLLFSGPLVREPGRVVDTPVSLLDLLPTLAEIAGTEVPVEARGRSLMPALQGRDLLERPIYSEGLNGSALDSKSIVYGGYKLVYSPLLDGVELYDLNVDPKEEENLAGGRPEKVAELFSLLQAWMEQSAAAAQALPRDIPVQAQDRTMQQLIDEAGY